MAILLHRNKKNSGQANGFGLVEIIIMLGIVAVLELNLGTLFLRLVYKSGNFQITNAGGMLIQQVGFMQSRARYLGQNSLSLNLFPTGSKYSIVDTFKVKQFVHMPEIAMPGISLLGPLTLSFLPHNPKQANIAYSVSSRFVPLVRKEVKIQPVTGRIIST